MKRALQQRRKLPGPPVVCVSEGFWQIEEIDGVVFPSFTPYANPTPPPEVQIDMVCVFNHALAPPGSLVTGTAYYQRHSTAFVSTTQFATPITVLGDAYGKVVQVTAIITTLFPQTVSVTGYKTVPYPN